MASGLSIGPEREPNKRAWAHGRDRLVLKGGQGQTNGSWAGPWAMALWARAWAGECQGEAPVQSLFQILLHRQTLGLAVGRTAIPRAVQQLSEELGYSIDIENY